MHEAAALVAMTAIRFIFFDFDDTLYDAERAYRAGLRNAWRRWRRQTPISWPRFMAAYLRARATVKRRLGDQPSARNRLLYFKAMTEHVFGRPRATLALESLAAYERCFDSVPWAPAHRVLNKLRRRYRLGLITNLVGDMQLKKLRGLDGRGELFDVVVTSEEIGVEKPAKRIFIEACARARCQPGCALMVGNSWDSDVRGALKAGLSAVFLDSRRPSKKINARLWRVRRLADLNDFF